MLKFQSNRGNGGHAEVIYIIRHGQTALNDRHLLQGRSDFPLNENGISQAHAAAERLNGIRFSCVYASPLLRAVQTARIIAPDLTPVIDDRLIEMDYGPYEGADLTHLPQEILSFFSDFVHNPAPEGMEQLSSVVARAGEFIEELSGQDGNILVSTHAIAMKAALEYLTPESLGSYWSKYIGNCAVYRAEYKDGVFSIPAEIYAG